MVLFLREEEEEKKKQPTETESQVTFSAAQLLLHSSMPTLCQGGRDTNSLWSTCIHSHKHATANTHTHASTHGWRLTLCSSVSLLPSPSLHKSQRERRRWEEENAYIKGEHRNKGFMGCKHPPGTKTHTNIYTAWRSRSPTNTFQTGD